jgi:preprotein translocase subunit YajC
MEFASLLPLVAIVAIFWLLVIRPANRRNQALSRLQGSIGPGDQVMLSSGFFGTVVALEDDRAHVELAQGVVVQVARAAVTKVVEPAPTMDDLDDDLTDEEG